MQTHLLRAGALALALNACGGSGASNAPPAYSSNETPAPAQNTPGQGNRLPAGQVGRGPTSQWVDVVAAAEDCRNQFASGSPSDGCITLVPEYDFVEGRSKPATTLLSLLCPKAANDEKRKLLVFELIVDSARLYWVKQGQPQPTGPLSDDKLAVAITNLNVDPLLNACGVTL
jgi:hypothetical protein